MGLQGQSNIIRLLKNHEMIEARVSFDSRFSIWPMVAYPLEACRSRRLPLGLFEKRSVNVCQVRKGRGFSGIANFSRITLGFILS